MKLCTQMYVNYPYHIHDGVSDPNVVNTPHGRILVNNVKFVGCVRCQECGARVLVYLNPNKKVTRFR